MVEINNSFMLNGMLLEIPSDNSLFNLRNCAISDIPVSFSEGLISEYNCFKSQFYNPSNVLYPSCGLDASPAKVFDNVTFVDIDPSCIRSLNDAGFKAINSDIRAYTPNELHDLLILLNPAIRSEWALQHLKSGGYILSNNYHGNATEMFEQPDKYFLVGTIDSRNSNNNSDISEAVLSRDVSDLFTPVKSGEELKRCRPEYYGFISKAYPHLLRTSNIEPEKKWELMYAQYQRTMGLSEELPSRRVAGFYIFQKK